MEYDSIVTSVINKFKQRSEFGKKKYGTDLDRTDLDVLDWITHAQEEFMDGILYLEKLKTYYLKIDEPKNKLNELQQLLQQANENEQKLFKVKKE